jgi:hypothetical protein
MQVNGTRHGWPVGDLVMAGPNDPSIDSNKLGRTRGERRVIDDPVAAMANTVAAGVAEMTDAVSEIAAEWGRYAEVLTDHADTSSSTPTAPTSQLVGERVVGGVSVS